MDTINDLIECLDEVLFCAMQIGCHEMTGYWLQRGMDLEDKILITEQLIAMKKGWA